MTNKILICVKIPMIDDEYDIFIPAFKTIFNVTRLIEQAISEMTYNDYVSSGSAMLYDDSGKLINPNTIVKDSGLTNGSTVIMI
ncbi:MAG: hypothetical protein IKD77_01250 [Bacilli bacterium]|nr:hypothetical protein [Bacilli bacterium]